MSQESTSRNVAPDGAEWDETTFHLGEQAIQKRLGVFNEIGHWASQVVRPFMPEQHRDSYSELPFLVAAARDAGGRPWATLLTGAPGFTRSPDPSRLVLETRPVEGDALGDQLVSGSQLGLLGIELATRRRNRVNGVIESPTQSSICDVGAIQLVVDQAFGNCPQYIREREWRFVPKASTAPETLRSERLDERMRERIEAADTFFIATGHQGDGSAPSHGMDASHRGGAPGFVRVEGERRIVFPDYAGNNHFNTIGNLVVDSRVGLLFVDFETGGMLQLTGHATIDWDSQEVAKVPGARRLVNFELDEAVDLPASLSIRWHASESNVRSLEVIEKKRESEDVMSFVFESRDGSALPTFLPGQHLPIELEIPDESGSVSRTYSLSNGPDEARYRISVKREALGTASRFLHDSIEVSDSIRTRAPAGEFFLEAGDRPIVCASAGIGVTPMLAMLREHVAKGDRRPIHFLHGARDGDHHPMKDEVRGLIAAARSGSLHVFYSQPRSQDVLGRDFDAAGRLDVVRIESVLPDMDADFYLCGPVQFMADLSEGLARAGAPEGQIHSESFGPTTIR
jgi:ferredoxin-NADP reductase/predicted pyridoxine 5'-phosphate oxidase superfamily flavin-nucleotide-binding protein